MKNFYHIIVATKDGYFSIIDKSFERIKEYLDNFIKKSEVNINGNLVRKKDIIKFFVLKSSKKFDEVVEDSKNNFPKELWLLLRREEIFIKGKEVENITEEVFKLNEGKKIFLVYGRDNNFRNEVKTFLFDNGFEVIEVSSEKSKSGKTIIELIEEYSDVKNAIILYSPDDEGKLRKGKELKKRARQNVVFEHGFFIGKLGRENVEFIVKGDIELPSDVSGILYIKYEKDWKYKLLKKLKDN